MLFAWREEQSCVAEETHEPAANIPLSMQSGPPDGPGIFLHSRVRERPLPGTAFVQRANPATRRLDCLDPVFFPPALTQDWNAATVDRLGKESCID